MNEAEKQAGNLKGFRRMRNVLPQPSGRKEKKNKKQTNKKTQIQEINQGDLVLNLLPKIVGHLIFTFKV